MRDLHSPESEHLSDTMVHRGSKMCIRSLSCCGDSLSSQAAQVAVDVLRRLPAAAALPRPVTAAVVSFLARGLAAFVMAGFLALTVAVLRRRPPALSTVAFQRSAVLVAVALRRPTAPAAAAAAPIGLWGTDLGQDLSAEPGKLGQTVVDVDAVRGEGGVEGQHGPQVALELAGHVVLAVVGVFDQTLAGRRHHAAHRASRAQVSLASSSPAPQWRPSGQTCTH